MTREEFAARIHWSWIIWFFGIINIVAVLPQFAQLWLTRKTEGLSLTMFTLIFLVQVAYSLQGFFRRDAMLMWTVGLAGILSLATIFSVLFMRYFN